MNEQPDTARRVHLALIIFIVALLAIIVFQIYGCGGGSLPPCTPFCPPTPEPTSMPKPTEAASPTAVASSTPKRTPTGTSTRTFSPTTTRPPVSPTPVATRTPAVPTPFQTTGGRAVIELDLAGFHPSATLDSYAFATVCFETPAPPKPAEFDCLQLGLRGTLLPPCEKKPCDNHMAVEVRASANARYDGADIDPNEPGTQLRPEREMCGEGTRPPRWIPLGPLRPVYPITVEWGGAIRDGVTVSTPAGDARILQGMRHPAFGWFTEGIPCGPSGKCGVGWSYQKAWTIGPQGPNGGRALLRTWEVVEPLPTHTRCP